MAWIMKRAIKWALLALAVPVTIWVADNVAEQIEERRGPNKATRRCAAPDGGDRRADSRRLTRSREDLAREG